MTFTTKNSKFPWPWKIFLVDFCLLPKSLVCQGYCSSDKSHNFWTLAKTMKSLNIACLSSVPNIVLFNTNASSKLFRFLHQHLHPMASIGVLLTFIFSHILSLCSLWRIKFFLKTFLPRWSVHLFSYYSDIFKIIEIFLCLCYKPTLKQSWGLTKLYHAVVIHKVVFEKTVLKKN